MERFCIGVDVSAKTIDVAWRRERRVECRQFANDGNGHRALIKEVKKRSRAIRVVMESTGCMDWIWPWPWSRPGSR